MYSAVGKSSLKYPENLIIQLNTYSETDNNSSLIFSKEGNLAQNLFRNGKF